MDKNVVALILLPVTTENCLCKSYLANPVISHGTSTIHGALVEEVFQDQGKYFYGV